jgi:hypothetical protein
MNLSFFPCLAMLLVCLSLSAQDKYGLVLDNNKTLQPQDTISLSYPSGSAIIICELFDVNTVVLGKVGALWSMSGNLTVLDTPLVAPRIVISASQAMNDQRGYVIATAMESGAQWISNKVFVKIKGKNSGVLRNLVISQSQSHSFRIFDIAGRMFMKEELCPSGIILMREASEKIQYKAIIIK